MLSGVLNAPIDFLDDDVRNKYEAIIADPSKINSSEYVQSYLLLKNKVDFHFL